MNCELKKWLAKHFAWKALIPDVFLDLEFEQGELYFKLYNSGGQPACNVQVRFNQPINIAGNRMDITRLPLFDSLSYLVPRKPIKIFIDVDRNFFQNNSWTELDVSLSWQDEDGCCYDREIRHNFKAWMNFGYKVSD